MRRTKDEAEQTKSEILKAALTIFSQKGYASTTLDDVAKAAGVTRGAIYWHFKNKQELYIFLINDANNRGDRVIADAMMAGGTFKEICRRILIAQWQLLSEDQEFSAVVKLVTFNTGIVPELEGYMKDLYRESNQLAETIAGYMKIGIEANQVRNDKSPLELAHAFLAYQQGVSVYWLQDPTRFSLKEMAPSLADIFINGL